MRATSLFASALIATLSLPACHSMPAATPGVAPTPPATAAAAVIPADDNLNAVLWMQRSVEYRAVASTIYRAATDVLDQALEQSRWDALAAAERSRPDDIARLPPAVIMDVDETVLDNSPYQARLIRDGKAYDEATWSAWVAEARAQPLPGVVAFAKAASAKGVTLVYLSNRAEPLQDATVANLRAVGMPVADDSVFLGLGTVVDGCNQHGSEKGCRRQLVGRRYRVLMQFGDQLGDFVTIAANTPAARDALYAGYDGWFGERWWMLPNPSYGAWEPAQFDNAWNLPADARRRAKRTALDVAR